MSSPDTLASTPARAAAAALDRSLHALAMRQLGGLSPISLGLAAADWAWHLLSQPATATRLANEALQATLNLGPTDQDPALQDPRFKAEAWRSWPYAGWVRRYQAAESWWQDATSLRGMEPHHQDVVRMFARQWLDMLSPANTWWSNPEVQQRTLQQGGANLLAGAGNALDQWRVQQGLPPLTPSEHPYQPGVDVAVTPGQVVWRNHLIELIQYSPQTPLVHTEPVFIVPSWIMKYYVLDLSPHNSLVRWLVAQGHTVFIVSWRNPAAEDALLSMEDYLTLGIFDALAAIARLVPGEAVQACGYCLGGTLLAIGAAALARPGQVTNAHLLAPLKSLSLLATETDFTEPGELGVLIDASQVALLEDLMAEQGYLSGQQMAASFQFLHARELVWSTRVREMLLGERSRPNDLMAWNSDVTRMPAVMHSEYLRHCYLHNDLAEGRYPVEGRPVSLSDIRLPIFAVGTEKDHVSPWHSVYKLHRLTETELCFVLASGGHNAGIVCEPGHAGRSFQQHTTAATDPWISPEEWQQLAPQHGGSWWPAWQTWLAQHSRGQVPAGALDTTTGLGTAPGSYVMQRYLD